MLDFTVAVDQNGRRCLHLTLPGIVSYKVTAETIQVMEIAAGGQAEALRLQRGAPTAAHLLLRGVAPLHAAALATPLGSLLIAGSSASGKSTLAALLHQRGYPVLADDIAGLEMAGGQPVVLPGYAGVTVWGDVLPHLGLDPSAGVQVHPELDKYRITPDKPDSKDPQPVRLLVLLSQHNNLDITVEPVTGVEKFHIISRYMYNTRLTDALVSRDFFFALSASIAASVPVYCARRPHRRWTGEQLADYIESVLR